MARTQEDTPFYIRTVNSETFSVDSLEEALEVFTSEEGYRMDLRLPTTDEHTNARWLSVRRAPELIKGEGAHGLMAEATVEIWGY